MLVYHHDMETNRYELVAHVASSDKEYGYRWTQNIYGSWSLKEEVLGHRGQRIDNGDYNEAVTVCCPLHKYDGRVYGIRSTSVGDIFVDSSYSAWMVASMGFTPLNNVDVTMLLADPGCVKIGSDSIRMSRTI